MSGVYISGMEMPKNCCECFAFKSNVSGYLFCKAKRLAFGKEDAEWLPKTTPNWCPLIPVPDHGRLVDVDVLADKDNADYDAALDDSMSITTKSLIMRIHKALQAVLSEAPTIIPADGKEAEG